MLKTKKKSTLDIGHTQMVLRALRDASAMLKRAKEECETHCIDDQGVAEIVSEQREAFTEAYEPILRFVCELEIMVVKEKYSDALYHCEESSSIGKLEFCASTVADELEKLVTSCKRSGWGQIKFPKEERDSALSAIGKLLDSVSGIQASAMEKCYTELTAACDR